MRKRDIERQGHPSGHWEIAGVPVSFDWGYFPKSVPCFPGDLVKAPVRGGRSAWHFGNCHASGTQIIAELGKRHMQSGEPICYTSADSVSQIAAHEDTLGIERLYDVCLTARRLIDPLKIGRVIARPFVGTPSAGFGRTRRRRDFSVPPTERTILDIAENDRRDIVSIGKIDDTFAHRGTGRNTRGDGNDALFDATLMDWAAWRRADCCLPTSSISIRPTASQGRRRICRGPRSIRRKAAATARSTAKR